MMIKPPQLDWTKMLGGGLIYIGYLMFLIILQILRINNGGDTASILNTAFIVFLMIYTGMIVFGLVAVVAHILKWLGYQAMTPEWQKREDKEK